MHTTHESVLCCHFDHCGGRFCAGEGYSVKDNVSNDGFQNTYTIDSDYGNYTVTGNAALAARKALEARGWKVSENVQLAAQKAGQAGGKKGASPAATGAGIVR